MADERPSSAPPGSQQDAPLVNLQIVSPSVGVGNLRFPDLPAATTVQQLKEKIRDSLQSRPADDHQRLIHRGRLLARDTDTLQQVFGEEAVSVLWWGGNGDRVLTVCVADSCQRPTDDPSGAEGYGRSSSST